MLEESTILPFKWGFSNEKGENVQYKEADFIQVRDRNNRQLCCHWKWNGAIIGWVDSLVYYCTVVLRTPQSCLDLWLWLLTITARPRSGSGLPEARPQAQGLGRLVATCTADYKVQVANANRNQPAEPRARLWAGPSGEWEWVTRARLSSEL